MEQNDATLSSVLWDEKDVARYFKVSVRTVQRWRADGDGPVYVRLGAHSVRYSQGAIRNYEASRVFDCRAAELAA